MNIKNDKFNVCVYSSNRSTYFSDVDLDELINGDTYKNSIKLLRNETYHSPAYDKIKSELPVFMTSAVYEQGQSKNKENAKILPLLCIDIDLQDNEEWFNNYSLDDTKFFLIDKFKSIRNISLSCGGKGLFVIHRLSDDVTKETFIDYFNELQLLYKNYNIIIDSQCSNFNRLRFVSYDEFAICNEIYEPYELQGIKEDTPIVEYNEIYDNTCYTATNIWKVNPKFDINNYKIIKRDDIKGYNAIRRVWLAMTCKKFFGKNGLKLAIDIFKAYPNSKVKDDSIEHLKNAFNGKSGCVRTIADDLYKLGILVENETSQNIFNLNDDEYIGDVITKIKFSTGFNLLVAGTGYGKTEVWKKLTRETGPDGMSSKNILVCEPRNSIIVSKYDNDTTLVYGSMKFPTLVNGLVVSNYDKLIRQRNIEWFEQFDYFVIDESHLLFSEAYRDNSIVPFVELLNRLKNHVKIIFQTATPTDEDSMFNIEQQNIFYVNKNIKKTTNIEYVNTFGDNMYNAMVIAEKALDNNEYDKVFIYNGTGSVNMDEAIAKQLNSKYETLVYHRKCKDKDLMKIFEERQRLDNYRIIITSTAASVGIDINDKGRVLLIIIDNITFEEEMQVSGRFRKCEDMKIINLIGNNAYNTLKWKNIRKNVFDTLDNSINTNTLYESIVTNNTKMFGVNIGNVVDYETKNLKYFQIKNQCLRSTYCYKKNKYNEYGWKLKEAYKSTNFFEVLKQIDGYDEETVFDMKKVFDKNGELKYYDLTADGVNYRIYGDKENGFVLCKKFYNDEETKVARKYVKKVSDENDHMKNKIYDILLNDNWSDTMYTIINENYPSIEMWCKTVVKCYKYYRPIFDCLDEDFIIKQSNIIYIIMKFIEMTRNDDFDWSEWEIIKFCRKISKEDEVDLSQYAYMLWCLYGSDETKNKLIKLDYSKNFIELYNIFMTVDDNIFGAINGQLRDYEYNFVDDMYSDAYIFNEDVEYNKQEIIRKLYKSHYYTDKDIKNIIKNSEEINKENIIEGYKSVKNYLDKKTSGKIGGKNGSPKKEVIITDKMKKSMLEKYNLKVNYKFESCSALAEHCKVKNDNITRWIKSGYVSKL